MEKSSAKSISGNESGIVYVLVAAAFFIVFVVVQGSFLTTANAIGSDLIDKMDSMSLASTESSTL